MHGETKTSDVLRTGTAREVAELHYQAVVEGNLDLWRATLKADYRPMVGRRGSTPDFWWRTGRKYATEYGVTYRFLRVDRADEHRQKLFFERLNADGTPRGMPVPIHLVRGEEGWRVEMATY